MKLLLIMACVLLSGCVGLNTNFKTKIEVCSANCKFVNEGGDTFISTPRSEYLHLLDEEDKPNKEKLLKHWGKPMKVNKKDNIETWHYYKKQWVGAIPMLVIPIPFILPLRDDEVEIKFKNDKMIEVKQTKTVDSTSLCSIFPVIADTGGFCWSSENKSFLSFDHRETK